MPTPTPKLVGIALAVLTAIFGCGYAIGYDQGDNNTAYAPTESDDVDLIHSCDNAYAIFQDMDTFAQTALTQQTLGDVDIDRITEKLVNLVAKAGDTTIAEPTKTILNKWFEFWVFGIYYPTEDQETLIAENCDGYYGDV